MTAVEPAVDTHAWGRGAPAAEATSPDRVVPPGDVAIPCPACEGRGEYGVRQDYWGNWETRQCPSCDGMAEVTPAEAEQITADLADRDDS